MGVGGQLHVPAALTPGKPGTHCIEGLVGPQGRSRRVQKSHPHRNSIPGPSMP